MLYVVGVGSVSGSGQAGFELQRWLAGWSAVAGRSRSEPILVVVSAARRTAPSPPSRGVPGATARGPHAEAARQEGRVPHEKRATAPDRRTRLNLVGPTVRTGTRFPGPPSAHRRSVGGSIAGSPCR